MFKKYSLGIILGTVCYFSSAPLVAAHAAVFLNEVQPGEWIEVYSDSGATDISGWKLDDAENGGSNPYEIPAGTAIPASGFLVFERATTNIDLDTTSDSVRLLNVSGNVADSTAYSSVPTGKTYGRSSDGGGSWTVCTTTTKAASNSGSCPVQSPTLTPTLTPTATPVPTGTPAPTATRTPTPQPSKTPTPKVSKTPTPEPTEEDLADSPAPDDAASPSPTPAPAPGGSNTLQPLAIMLAFIGGGLGLIAALLVWKKRNALKMAKAMPQDLPNNEIP